MKSTKTTLATLAAVVALAGFFGTNASAQEAGAGTDLENLDWVERGPIAIVRLWGDDSTESAFLLKQEPGYKNTFHAHSEDYHGVTLQGVWLKTIADGSVIEVPVGSHFLQTKEEMHIDACAGPDACVLLIHFDGPRDIIRPDDPGNSP